jgi:spermidine synthase
VAAADEKTNAVRSALIWLAALLSGGAALAYEVSWSRALVVPLGNSTDATALVLAAFMIGIGVGAKLAGRLAERVESPLRLYALAEIVLGLYALAAPSALSALTAIPSGVGGALPRQLAAIGLIALPCLAMGASLPLLVRALTGPRTSLDVQIGVAYGANTTGAAIGAVVTGFWGVALLGVARGSAWAATASFAAAGLALLASRQLSAHASEKPRPGGTAKQAVSHVEAELGRGSEGRRQDLLRLAALLGAFISGFVMLANEMLWARVLTFVFGHDTYAFASLLAFVLVGLAAGGLTHRVFAKRDQATLLAVLLGAFSIVFLASFWWSAALVIHAGRDPFDLDASGSFATSIRLELLRELAYTPLLVLLPSMLAGAAFPAACSLFGRDADDAGRRVGDIAFVNGIGAACGALIAALGLITVTGIQGAFVTLALLSSVASAAVFAASRRRSKNKTTAALAFLPVATTVALALLMPRSMPRDMLLATVGPRHQTLLHYEEARTGTVSVTRNDINGERVLLMNAVNEVTTRLVHDQSFKVLGHLAPLLHPSPKRGVMICLGAGLSAGAALTHPLERLDVIDLSSAVSRGARYFSEENNRVLDDPRFHLHIDDGRQFLLNTQDRYDVAIIDSTHPKAVDSWILYTSEFYALVSDRLGDDGIAVQWLPLHGLSENEFKIIVRTFLQAFPKMTLWANVGFETYGQVGYAKLVGTRNGDLPIDYGRLAARLDGTPMGKDLAAYGIDGPEELLDLFVAGSEAIDAWTKGLPVQTDDHPLVPYTTKYSVGRRMVPGLLSAIRAPMGPPLQGTITTAQRAKLQAAFEAQGLVLTGNLARARQLRPNSGKLKLFVQQKGTSEPYYTALAQRYPDDVDKQFEAATQLAGLGHPEPARAVYEHALTLRPDDFRTRLDLAHLLINLGETDRAVDLLSALRIEYPDSAIVHHNLGVATMASGDPGTASAHLEAALRWDPSSIGVRLALARARLALDELDDAQFVLRAVIDENPWVAEAYQLLGHVEAKRGALAEAEKDHQKAHFLEPMRASFLFDLGLVRQRRGHHDEAIDALRGVLRIDPNHARAAHYLGVSFTAQQRYDEAAEYQLHALEIDPGLAPAALELGIALRGQKHTEQAVDALCLALRLDAKMAEARAQLASLEASCER